MSTILSGIFSAVMAIIVSLSASYPALFDGEIYIDPKGEKVVYTSPSDLGVIDRKETLITDYEEFKAILGERASDFSEYNEDFFAENNIAFVPVILPDSRYKLFVKSIIEDENVLEIDAKIVTSKNSFGAMMQRAEIIIIETSKNITEIDYDEEKITVPFSIREADGFDYLV